MLFIKELNPELNTQKGSLHQTLYVTLCVNTLLHYHHIFFALYSCLLGILFTFIVGLISFIRDSIMTLSERRNVVAFETFNQDGFKLFNFIAMFYS